MHAFRCWTIVLLFTLLAANSHAKERAVISGLAERMTAEAAAAGAAGAEELRQSLLDQVLTIAPDHAPARWAQGQVQVDGKWQSVSQVQAATRSNEKLDKYTELCETAEDTYATHSELARWCRRNNLNDEARYHWLKVLRANPQNRQALDALDSAWHDGKLVSPDEAKRLRRDQTLARKTDSKWQARIKGWKRHLEKGGDEAELALADLRASVDESAIRAFEKLADGAGQWEKAGPTRERELVLAFVDALAEMPTYMATESLARFAVLAPQESLRSAATEHLADRPKEEYMPLLLERLASPIETRFDVRRSMTGRVSYTHEAYTEGRDADELKEISISGQLAMPTNNVDPDDFEAMARANLQARQASDRQVRRFIAQAAELERQAARENAKRAVTNERVVAVLEKVTGKTFGEDLRAWWNYWTMHNEYELVTYRPTVTYRDSYEFEIPRPRSCECFVAGTLVWTKKGETPIEEIQEGDLVLTQDVETGELCFRPVTGTTVREPTPIVSVTAGEYQIDSTLGHPFWVAGEGWRMAKELKMGDRLQTIDGPLEITAVEDLDDAEAFNLIVWGTNNYFVGEHGALVHDNTPRRPDRVRAGTRP